MGRIRTRPRGPSETELAEVRGGYSLYRATHFYERKSIEALEATAREAIHQRAFVPKGQAVRLQGQVGVPITFYKSVMRRG